MGAIGDNTYLNNFFDASDVTNTGRALNYLEVCLGAPDQDVSPYVALFQNQTVGYAERFPRVYSSVYSTHGGTPYIAFAGLHRQFVSRLGFAGGLHMNVSADIIRGMAAQAGPTRIGHASPVPTIRVPHTMETEGSSRFTSLALERAGFTSVVGNVMLSGAYEQPVRLPDRQVYFHGGREPAAPRQDRRAKGLKGRRFSHQVLTLR